MKALCSCEGRMAKRGKAKRWWKWVWGSMRITWKVARWLVGLDLGGWCVEGGRTARLTRWVGGRRFASSWAAVWGEVSIFPSHFPLVRW